MAASKLLQIISGVITQVAAIVTSSGSSDDGKIPALNSNGVLDSTIVNSTTTSAGAGSSGKVVALDGSGKIDTTMMPTGVGADTALISASENLAAGDFVNVHDSSGAKVRKADATAAGKEAHGFVLSAVTSGNNATVYFEGTNTQVSGLTPGKQFLLTTAGTAGATAPSGSGNVVQCVGFATSATALNFNSGTPVVLA